MTNVSNQVSPSRIDTSAIDSMRDVARTGTQTPVGSGINGGDGTLPPPTPEAALAEFNSVMAAMGITMSTKSSEILIAEVAVSMRDTQSANEKGKIELDQKTMKGLLADQQAKIEEAERKQAEANEKKESASTADKIKLAFEWLGAAIAVAVAVVMIATGVGAVVGALLLAAALTAIVMAIDSTMKMTDENGLGMVGQGEMARGQSLKDAKKADMIFGITMAVAGAVFSIAGGGAGVANAAKQAVQAGVQAGRIVYDITGSALQATKAALSVSKDVFMASLKAGQASLELSMKITQKALDAAQDVTALGTSASNVASSIQRNQASIAEAGVKRAEGEAKEIDALMMQINDMLDQAFARLFAAGNQFSQMMDSIMEAKQDRAATLTNFKFRA
ncbi:type III secretion system translocon subunit SctE [Aureimonas jatrophae]|uniref:Secretion system effector C (SseC) like family protein n=1 Tax=Aureimonas jatrophae TaxID=1166073 RepID=A0A1H0ET02_9HYPH|nr:type III secretion system translocon subunit SctE [Aureimonas jatrophae]MBB3950333.1 hypothetical protein [Aureimonas jatrophae]SDN85409.1 Secretion system effector C (SseC) like family protein [Aureimonas jatrophae]